MTSILMVLTGARVWNLKDGTAHPTGFWVEEFAAPHRIFVEAGAEVTIATPGGVTPVGDELSLAPAMNGGDEAKVADLRAYLNSAKDILSGAVPLESVNPGDYDVVIVPGGHGPMEDLAVNPYIGGVLKSFLEDPNKVVASLCHGLAGFFPATDDAGKWLFKGRKMTSFLDEEERQAGFADKAPWLLESRLRSEGAIFDAGPVWGSHVVVDGNLVTGQNPASAEAAAQAVLKLVKERATN